MVTEGWMSTRRSRLTAGLLFMCLSAFAVAPVGATTDLVFLMDGSGSISGADWQLQKDGISAALRDSTSFPRDGSISVGLVQFSYINSTQRTRVEIGMTNVNGDAAVDALVAQVQAIGQIRWLTNPGDAVRRGTDLLLADGTDPEASDWVLCMSTDGITNSGESLGSATSYAQSNDVDRYSVIAIEDPPFVGADGLQAHYGPHVFGDGAVTVARNSVEFASLIIGGCLGERVELRALEVNQSIQNWHNSVTLRRDKSTTVRAFVQAPTGEGTRRTVGRLFGFRGSTELTGSPLLASNAGGSILAAEEIVSRRDELDDSLNFILPTSWLNGTVTLEFDAGGAPVTCQEPSGAGTDVADDCKVTVSFQDQNTSDVVFVGVSYKDSRGDVIAPTAAELSEQHLRFQSIFPVASINFTSDSFGPYDSKPSLSTVLTDLSLKRTNDDSSAFYYGVLKGSGGGLGYRPGFVSAGFLSGSGATGGTGYARNRGPHELAHNLGRFHAVDDALGLNGDGKKQGRCGSTAPSTAPQHTPFATISTDVRPVLGPLDSGTDDEIWGLDNRFVLNNTNDLAVIDPRMTFELLSYCGGGPQARWISSYTYDGVAGSFPAGTGGSSDLSFGDYLFVRGNLNLESDSALLAPLVKVTGSPPSPTPGTYRAAFLDDFGNEIAAVDFEPLVMEADAEAPGGPEPPSSGTILVPLTVPAARIAQVLVSHDGVPVASETASDNAPIASIHSPAGGEVFTGSTIDVGWTGSDADGDSLTYSVFYSQDNGANWELLAADLTETTLSMRRSRLPGSDLALMQVQASDGVNIGTAVSNLFTVGNNSPRVTIHSPSDGQFFSGVQNANMFATAFDTEDGQLSGSSLTWSSSLNGFLGSGQSLIINAADLLEGTHTISVTATDQDGASNSDSIFVRIFRIAPLPPIADAGPDQTLECENAGTATAGLDGSGSSDPEGGSLTYTWMGPFPEGSGVITGVSPFVTMPLGTQFVTLTVEDIDGLTDSDTVSVTVQDTTAPEVELLEPDEPMLLALAFPMSIVFTSDDSCGVAREVVFFEDCPILDGSVFGDGDGLLSDEVVEVTLDLFCSIVTACGYHTLENPELRVEVTDFGGNEATDSHEFDDSFGRRSGLCSGF